MRLAMVTPYHYQLLRSVRSEHGAPEVRYPCQFSISRRLGMTAAPSAQMAGTIDVGGDLTVNRLGFGAMRITGEGIWGPPPDRDEAKRVLRRALEVGITFIDTADSYGPDVSEEIIAEALYPYP